MMTSMIRLQVFDDAGGAVDLAGAYLVGADCVPVRAEMEAGIGEVRCTKRSQGPAALSLMWSLPPFGSVMMETTRLMERERPYVLAVELARGRLMRISQKREDWGLFDYPGGEHLYERVESAKERFIEALVADDEHTAAIKGHESLTQAVSIGEELSLFHASVFLQRRKEQNQFPARPLGCGIVLGQKDDAYRNRVLEAFDFALLPVSWRTLESKQGSPSWDTVDPWLVWASKRKLPVRINPLVSFNKTHLPDWVFLYEQDYEAIRDLLTAHVRRTVQRLGPHVAMWDVASGLNAHNTFNLTFEQIIELTRLSSTLVKQLAPKATAIIDIIAPWGEYYARNPRTIAPMLYADTVATNGIPFDAFGLQFYFGVPVDGMYVRDMMQISATIDKFANLGKPLHITAVQVPSAAARDPGDNWGGQYNPALAGVWRQRWSEPVQAEWLQRFYEIALSKPFVESVTWRDLADTPGHYLPHGGLLREDLTPKPAYEQLMELRRNYFRRGRGR